MRDSSAYVFAAALTALCAALALWAWVTLPPGAGVPFNTLGLDGTRHVGSSRAALWLLPAVSLMVTLAFLAGATRGGVQKAALSYQTTLMSVVGVLLVAEYALAGRAFDPAFNVLRPVALAVGALLLVVGNYLGKARQNAVFGVRTPWTLADASVWDKTHRFTGRAMFLGGLVLIGVSLAVSEATALALAMVLCAAGPALGGVAYSLSLSRRRAAG
jgi:uncharacterized membrane protein